MSRFRPPVSGALNNPTTVAIHVVGTGIVSGLGCPFTLNGIGTIFDNVNAITIPYTGTTCFGPVSGTADAATSDAAAATRRTRATAAGREPVITSPPGPLSDVRASQVIFATADEFPHLLAPIGDIGQKMANAEEMLLRCIWHLQHAGYPGRASAQSIGSHFDRQADGRPRRSALARVRHHDELRHRRASARG